MLKSFFLFAITSFFVVGCQLQPPYQPPVVPTPSEWKQTQTSTSELPDVDNWWEIFEDQTLNELEEEAIQNSYTLESAIERVIQARDQAKIARSQLFPQINLLPAYSNQDVLTKLFTNPATRNACAPCQQLLGSTSSSSISSGSNVIREHQLLYSLPLSLSYELDLWGRLRGQYKAAIFQTLAQQQNFATAMLMLTTDLASTYFQLRTQDNLIDLFRKTIETRKKAVSITTSRYESKIINYEAVALAELDLHNVETQYEEAVRQRTVLENQIAVLLGTPASSFHLEPSLLTHFPPEIPASLPSEVLLQRPDLAAQEYTMAAFHQQIGVAYASFFPQVNISGSIGFSSPLSKYFADWKSRYWAIGTNISQFIFDAGARYYNAELAWSDFREAVDEYQQRVVVAFQEVENALVNLEQIAKEMNSSQRAIRAAHQAYTVALDQYLNGINYYLAVADNERQELDNQRIYQNLLGLRYVNTVQLIKALGGRWKLEAGCEE